MSEFWIVRKGLLLSASALPLCVSLVRKQKGQSEHIHFSLPTCKVKAGYFCCFTMGLQLISN